MRENAGSHFHVHLFFKKSFLIRPSIQQGHCTQTAPNGMRDRPVAAIFKHVSTFYTPQVITRPRIWHYQSKRFITSWRDEHF